MSSHSNGGSKYVSLLQEFSVPLLAGVVVALIVANADYARYERIVKGTWSFFSSDTYHGHGHDAGHTEHKHDHDDHSSSKKDHHDSQHDDTHVELNKGAEVSGDHHQESHDTWHHYATLHFVINDIFMVIFFGVAAKEITEACLPGGALNPPSKAINPLLGTIGGVLGPVGAYFLLNMIMGEPAWQNGWGIPTATDIALAWLIARMVFGNGHPAIAFLLLLAVADDGIGLAIIAIFYPNPEHPTEWINALWVLPGMLVAYGLRRMNVLSWLPYILLGGGLSWWGLFSAHLHPALALVPIVPLLPGPKRDDGLFQEEVDHHDQDPLNKFEHDNKLFVDFGLFFFAFANAGVQLSNINNLTWIVFLSLLVGKTVGITFFSYLGILIGFPLPSGMKVKHLVVAGIVAGLGLTVALFVAGQAFGAKAEIDMQGAAKMGALFSGAIALVAIVVGRILGVKDGATG